MFIVPKEGKPYKKEKFIYNLMEDLLIMMEDSGITTTELSTMTSRPKRYVEEVLNGHAPCMTLDLFYDICFSLGFEPEIKIPVKNNTNNLEEDT